jgi:hypothetical protein
MFAPLRVCADERLASAFPAEGKGQRHVFLDLRAHDPRIRAT